MKALHKITVAMMTVTLAGLMGHVMQNASHFGLASRQGAAFDVAGLTNVTAVANIADAPAGIEVTGLRMGAVAELPDLPRRAVAADAATGPLPLAEAPSGGFARCPAPALKLAPAAGASVLLSISAPCAADAAAEIRHEGLVIPVQLDAAGDWSGLVPALSPAAFYSVELPEGQTLAASVAVSGLELVNRVVVNWTGAPAFLLNAFERGASWGGAGHVRAEAPGVPDAAGTGWLLSYGLAEVGQHLQVYTAPAGLTGLALDLEAPVSDVTCGTDLRAGMRRVIAGRPEAPEEIAVAMPGCDDLTGDVVVPLPDLPVSVATN